MIINLERRKEKCIHLIKARHETYQEFTVKHLVYFILSGKLTIHVRLKYLRIAVLRYSCSLKDSKIDKT